MRQFLHDRNALTLGPLWCGAFLVWGIVPNDVNDTFVRVPRFDLGEKLNGAYPIDGGWFKKRARRRFPGSERRECSRAHAQMSFE